MCLGIGGYTTLAGRGHTHGLHGVYTLARMTLLHWGMTSKPHGNILTDARLARDNIVQQCTRMHSKGDAPELPWRPGKRLRDHSQAL